MAIATSAPTDTSVEPPQNKVKKSKTPYLLIAPAVVILLIALGYPLIWQFITSMQEYGLAQQFGSQPPKFVGFDNYVKVFTDPYMWTVVVRSVVFCFAVAISTMLIGIGVSLLMRSAPTWVRIALQIAMLLAWAMPVVAAMTIWSWMFDWSRGLINYILGTPGHNWLENPISFFMVAGIIIVWMSVPFVAFSVYAGLTQVPEEVLEAAEMDGASPVQQLWRIIIPMVKPVLGIVFLLQIIWDLRVFAQIKMLQEQGGHVHETNLLGTYIYQEGVGKSNFGMASAISVFVLFLTIGISWFYVRNLMKEEDQ